jgi:alpha-tubulin suppressor-like RCC1 family protein
MVVQERPAARELPAAASSRSRRRRASGWTLRLACTLGVLAAATVPAPAADAALTTAERAPLAGESGQLTAGDSHSCALTDRGRVRCWGGNQWGQLGDGSTVDRPTPVDVVGLSSGIRSVDAGWAFTCAVTRQRSAACWGYNLRGQLGDGTTVDRPTPVQVTGLTRDVTAVTAGVFHACALSRGGAVSCWGLNHRGQLGNGTTDDSATPVPVVGLDSGVEAISAGYFHTCAVLRGGAVKCWGQNSAGELGDGTTVDRSVPVEVVGLDARALTVAAATGSGDGVDASSTCALVRSPRSHGGHTGEVRCWGLNHHGQLGDGTTIDRPTPVRVAGLDGATAVDFGGGFACSLTAGGSARCWGINFAGELGDGTTVDRHLPTQVVGLDGGVVQVAAGGFHGCSLSGRGRVMCWGGNPFGQVGDGTAGTNRLSPVDVSGSFYRPECPTLLAARHTSFTLSEGYARGSVASFAADSGYALVGAATLVCGRDLTWSGEVPAAAGTGAVTVVPDTGLVDGQLVEVRMTGFPAGGSVGWCQAALAPGPPSASDCGGPVRLGQADAGGSLTDPGYAVARFIEVPALGRVVDCADPAETCVLGAADITDVGASAATATITFSSPGTGAPGA